MSKIKVEDMNVYRHREIMECSKHSASVLNGLFDLLQTQKFCDVVLTAELDGKKVHAHRLVLSATSKYFESMFTGKLRESTEGEVTLKEVHGQILENLVQFSYTGRIEVQEDTVETLLATASLLMFPTVVEACGDFLVSQLTPSNCLNTACLADKYELREVYKKTDHFIRRNIIDVCKSDDFFHLSADELCRILSKDDIHIETEEFVFNSVMSWIQRDEQNRKQYIPVLLGTVRLGELDPSFIFDKVEPMCRAYGECTQMVLNVCKWQMLPAKRSRLTNEQQPRKCIIKMLAVSKNNKNVSLKTYGLKINAWTNAMDNFTPPLRDKCGIAFLDNMLMFVGGMYNGKANNSVYSIDLNTLELKNRCAINKGRYGMGLAVLNEMLYVVGGVIPFEINSSNRVLTNTMERWDPVTDTWTFLAPMSSIRMFPAVAVLEGNLYAVGGWQEDDIDIVECYNPRANMWSLKSPMNIKRSRCGVAVVNGYLYAVGGSNVDCNAIDVVERYDPNDDKWSMVAPLIKPIPFLKCTVFNNKIIAGNHRIILEYDPIINKWTEFAPFKSWQLLDFLTGVINN